MSSSEAPSNRLFREYAIEPDVVVAWAKQRPLRVFLDGIGLGSSRIVAAIPSKRAWRERVRAAIRELGDNDRKRAEEIIARLADKMSSRCTEGMDCPDWPEFAGQEHSRHPFDAVVVQQPEVRGSGFVPCDPARLEEAEEWDVKAQLSVLRGGPEIAGLMAPILRGARRIIIVDPHMGPSSTFVRPLSRIMQASLVGRCALPPEALELHAGGGKKDSISAERFRNGMGDLLPSIVPRGWTVRVKRWKDIGGDLHNRFVLTELGGVMLGAGLGEAHGQDELIVLAKDIYTARWHEFVGKPPTHIEFQESFSVDGIAPASGFGGPR